MNAAWRPVSHFMHHCLILSQTLTASPLIVFDNGSFSSAELLPIFAQFLLVQQGHLENICFDLGMDLAPCFKADLMRKTWVKVFVAPCMSVKAMPSSRNE